MKKNPLIAAVESWKNVKMSDELEQLLVEMEDDDILAESERQKAYDEINDAFDDEAI